MPIKKIAYYISLISVFLIPLFPLIVLNSLYFPFITGKAIYFRLLVEIAFAAWIILAFLDAKYRPKFNWITVAVTLFAFIALIADLLGVNTLRSLWSNFERMEGWLAIIHLWGFYLVTTSLFNADGDKKMWHKWLNFNLLVALVVAAYGLFQLFGWAQIHQSSSRLDASLGNSAYLAVYMLFSVFVAAYFLVGKIHSIHGRKAETSSVWLKVFYGFQVLFFSLILLETQTRGTILGLVGGIMLALLLFAVFGKKEQKKWRWISTGCFLFIILLGVLFWFNRDRAFIKNDPVLGRFTNISWSEASGQARQYIWPMALKGAMERPLYGWGQENFNYIFNANYNPKMWSQEQWFDRAHNVFIDWLVASGIVGLLAYLTLYFLIVLYVWRSSLSVAEKSVLTGLLAGYFVHNIFVFDNLASYVWFFSLLGLASSFKQNQPVLFGKHSTRPDVVEYIVAPVSIVALVLVVYFIQIRPLQANTRLMDSLQSCASQPNPTYFQKALSTSVYMANQETREQLLTCASNVITRTQASNSVKKGFYDLALSAIQQQIEVTPKDARAFVLGGSFLDSIGQYPQAIPLLEKAYLLSPSKQTVAFELATAYLNTGMSEKAVSVLKKAYESSPDFYQAKVAYVTSLVFAGREAEARQLFQNDPSIFNTKQIAQAFISLKQYAKAIVIYRELIKAKTSDEAQLRFEMARIQYMAGMNFEAISTLRELEKDYPELKTQLESVIEQIQNNKI